MNNFSQLTNSIIILIIGMFIAVICYRYKHTRMLKIIILTILSLLIIITSLCSACGFLSSIEGFFEPSILIISIPSFIIGGILTKAFLSKWKSISKELDEEE